MKLADISVAEPGFRAGAANPIGVRRGRFSARTDGKMKELGLIGEGAHAGVPPESELKFIELYCFVSEQAIKYSSMNFRFLLVEQNYICISETSCAKCWNSINIRHITYSGDMCK